MNEEIKRGELYWVDWSPSQGSEQSGVRPGLIIQNNAGNKFSPTTIVAACSTANIKPYPFIVQLSKKESGLPQDCVVNCSAILTIDKSCLTGKCGELDDRKMAEVDEAVKRSLALK
jgi:mRNA interferase MazF